MQIINEYGLMPRMGSADTLFERLLEYIDNYDKEWEHIIQGADEDQIEELRKYDCSYIGQDLFGIWIKKMLD